MTRRKGEENEKAEPHFRGKCQTSLKFEDVDEGMKEFIKKIYNSFIEFQRQGSNWTIDKVVNLAVHMARCRPLRSSSYIPLPINLRSKHAIINVKNKDNKCFMCSVIVALYPPRRNGERVWKYKGNISDLNFKDISFSVKMDDIPKFEKQNDVSINIFGYEKNEIFPVHITNHRFKRHINLLMISDNRKNHYCWIKDLNRLLGDQHSNTRRYHYCSYCLYGFIKERLLEDHIPYCQTHGPQKIKLLKEEDNGCITKIFANN